MPSRRSPSQREKGFRIDRVLGLFGGSHAGRVVNATPVTVVTPSVPAVEPAVAGAAITPGGQRTVDIMWPSSQAFVGDGTPVSTVTGWDSSAAHAATATAFGGGGSQLLLCTDGKEATYHARIEGRFFRTSLVSPAPVVTVEFDLNNFFGYQQSALTDVGQMYYSWQGFRHCVPGQAINTFDMKVTAWDGVGNSYRMAGDNIALILTRMPA